MIDEFNEFAKENGFQTHLISAATGEGVRELINVVAAELAKLPPIVRYEAEEPVREEITSKQEFKIHIEDGIYVVEAPWLMHALGFVDLDDYESLQYFQRVLRLSGIIDKLEEMIDEFNEFAEENGFKTYLISAATGEGVKEPINAVASELAKLPPIVRYETEEPVREEITSRQEFKIHIEDGIYVVEAPWLMHALGFVDLDDYESLQYFQRVLRLSGIIDELERMGINEGDTVSILDIEFDYMR
jgi:Obg family GTPase CgtA-like protein